jgi:hypothetical protein
MGEVYRARDTNLKHVALKVLPEPSRAMRIDWRGFSVRRKSWPR